MAVINTGLLEKGLNSAFFARFDGTPSHFERLATRIVSTSDNESYKWLGSTPRMREWGSGRLAKGIRTEKYSVENEKYESTIEVDRDEIDDDKTGQIRIRVEEMAARAATHKDFLIGELLKNGDSAGFLAYDGKVFFAADHQSGDSGVQSNKLDHAGTVDVDDPTTAEFKSAFGTALAQLMGFLDDVGNPLNTTMEGLVVVVPTTMMIAAREALNASIIANTSNILAGAADVIAFPWLSDKSKWYLLKVNEPVRPFIFQDRAAVEFTSLTEGSDETFRREKFLFGVRARYAMSYGRWEMAVRNDFTA